MRIFWPHFCRIQLDGVWHPTPAGRELCRFLEMEVDVSRYHRLVSACIGAYTREALPLEEAWAKEHWPPLRPGARLNPAFQRIFDEGVAPDGSEISSFPELTDALVTLAEEFAKHDTGYTPPKRPLHGEEAAFAHFVETYLDNPDTDSASFWSRDV